MRGLRMNTLGWFDFKSAWFAPPDLKSQLLIAAGNKITTLTPNSTGVPRSCAR
ncbi:ABC transporter periplasmic solute binding protein [Salmonella enterica subsp. enterica]|uniref:ABC transporter periplasmic solute binding protein n=1 Tax=Salmonella enterica I TaxID=59201 RepID=A0A3S4FC35_SALET|nr:ABC transporter periplasmic solute binding protein [Salmonella enterica subsp. enterica]